MKIFVTAQTLLVKPQHGARLVFQSRVGNEGGFMTGFAFLSGMCSFQLKTGFAVVESLFVQSDQLKITSVMLIMAFGTLLSGNFGGSMESFVGGNIGLNFFMAA